MIKKPKISNLSIKIFADGASLESIKILNKKNYIKGFTTNPTLMTKAKIKNYKSFAIEAAKIIGNKPLSVEVFADDMFGMEKQAYEISSWSKNIYVKIPITNTKGEYTYKLIKKLMQNKVKCNITAIFTIDQIKPILKFVDKTRIILSVFAGRIADAGYDPVEVMSKTKKLIKKNKNIELLWASPREVYNIFEAEKCGCDIITVGYDLLKKFDKIGINLEKFSLETVKMFYEDAKKSNYKI